MGKLRDQVAYRLKALVLAAGLSGIALLEWASTSADVAHGLEQGLPAPLVPLVPIVLGGIATLIAVHQTENTPLPSVPAPTLEPPTPAAGPVERAGGTPAAASMPAAAESAPLAAAPSAAPAVAGAAPFWAGVPTGAATSPTSLVQLRPIPESSPL